MTRAIINSGRRDVQLTGDLLEAFAEFLRLRVGDGDASPATIRSYWSSVRQFVQWCAGQDLEPAQATEHDLAAYRHHLIERGYKRGTIAVKLAAIRRLYQAATWRGLRADNPAAGVKAPKERTAKVERVKYLPLGDLVRLLDAPDNARDRAMIYLMGAHGLRVAEVAELRLDDLDLDAGTLRVAGKGTKTRTRNLTEHTADILRRWLGDRQAAEGERALFVAMDHRTAGHGMTARGVRYAVDKWLRRAGLKAKGVSCHSLRHSFATWSLAAGAKLLAISDALGHANVETTQVYAKIADRAKENPTLHLEELLGVNHAANAEG